MTDLRTETPRPGVRLLTLTRAAKRNALSMSLIGELNEAIARAEADGMRAIVIAAEGPAFSAGADFSDLEGTASDETYDAAMSSLTAALRGSRLISFAAIDGVCVGAGLDMALACDFRVAGANAGFALPSVQMGILYNPARLAEILPLLSQAAARRLLLLSERLNRADAQAAGVVTHAAEGAASMAATELAGRAAALPPKAQAATKAFVAASQAQGFDPQEWQAPRKELLASDERREALAKAKERKK